MSHWLTPIFFLIFAGYQPALANSEIPRLEAPKEPMVQCALIIDALERAGTDPLLLSLVRLMNERLAKLETPPAKINPVAETIRAVGLDKIRTEILAGRLEYGDEVHGYLLRDTSGAPLRLAAFLKKIGSKKGGKGRSSITPHILTGLLAWVVRAEREGIITHDDLKGYVAAAFLKRKTFAAEPEMVRIPIELNEEIESLLQKMGMNSRGSMQIFMAGAIHLMADVFEVPEAKAH